jgi:hypothetical protein
MRMVMIVNILTIFINIVYKMSYTSHQSYSYSSNGGGKSKSSNRVVRIENGVVVEDSKIETKDGVRVKSETLKENDTSKVVLS